MRKLLYIIPLLIAFTFTGGPPGGWYQQFVPDLGGRSIQDITFTDSLTGYIVSTRLSFTDTSIILKTTDGGDNWMFVHSDSGFIYKQVQFLNDNTGYVAGSSILKTTDAGINWFEINTPVPAEDIYVLNEDTIWIVFTESLTGGVFRTTNGGINWTRQLSLGSQNPDHIYMINGSTGFIAEGFNYLRKTTNGGLNWIIVSGTDGFLDMHFIDNLTGWKAYGFMKKTTDGGDTWITQPLQTGGQLITSNMARFSVLNKDTIWGVGGQIHYGGSQIRGVLWRTTNGGNNWEYQAPDTAFGNFNYYHIQFIDPLKGWAYSVSKGVHTVTGGDPNFTSIHHISNEILDDFELYQNYPNPFNPSTSIKFKVKSSNFISLKIFDISGKEVSILVNEKLQAGEYEYRFDGADLSSGIYYYQLKTNDFTDTKKMVLVK